MKEWRDVEKETFLQKWEKIERKNRKIEIKKDRKKKK